MVKHSLKFLKRRIILTCYVIVFIGSLSAGAVSSKTFLAILVLLPWYFHAASSNDYSDRKIDEVNLGEAKNRPLIANSISHKTLWALHLFAGFATLGASLIYGRIVVLLTLAVLLYDYAYSFKPIRITDRGIISQLTLPFAYVLFPLSLGYWSVDTDITYPWLLLAGLYTGFVARLMLKDFRDVKGDKMFGKCTFLLRHGRLATCYMSEFFALVSLIILSFVINFSLGAFIILVVGHVLASWFLIILSRTSQIDRQVKLVNTIAKTANGSVIVILTFYFLDMINAGALITSIVPFAIGSLWYFYIWVNNKDDIQSKLA